MKLSSVRGYPFPYGPDVDCSEDEDEMQTQSNFPNSFISIVRRDLVARLILICLILFEASFQARFSWGVPGTPGAPKVSLGVGPAMPYFSMSGHP
jgi:hypothetical protein